MLKSLASRLPGVPPAWSAFRAAQLHREYEKRREHYARTAAERGLVYSERETVAAVRARLASRGAVPKRRAPGDVHTFAFVSGYAWHEELLPDLAELGPVSRFDYRGEGFDWFAFARADRAGIDARSKMNERVLAAARAAHATRRLDWAFIYASGLEISASTVTRIGEELGIPTVNMCLDDKQSWTGPWMGDHRGGQVDLARAFDLSWTSARVACEWYLVEGGRPLYMPEGFDGTRFRPLDLARDLPVSFVGGAYGRRARSVRWLRANGIDVRVFGSGWPGSEPASNLNEIANRSIVNLGMGEIGHSKSLTNVKGRDFQIPGAGGGAYLTSYNADLAQHFEIGREILCYRTEDEMLELLRWSLARPHDARLMSARARARSLSQHRWLHRYRAICSALGIVDPETPGGEA